MDITGIILGAFVGAILVFLFVRSNKKDDSQSFVLLQNQLNNLVDTLDRRLADSQKEMQSTVRSQFSDSQKIIENITEKVTRLDETNKQVVSFADQLQSLQDILKNPKQRGILGEFYLETILQNVLPANSFEMQYSLGKDETTGKNLIVDAVIKVGEKIIPIDSKFSLENYNRLAEERNPIERERLEKLFKQDLKNRIDETAKYVLPNKDTLEFAFMFIPSEAIYYDLTINQSGVGVNSQDLIQYANAKRVHIVSPNSFYAFLQTVLIGLKQLSIEKSTKEIMKQVEALTKHLKAYQSYQEKLGGALQTTVNHYNASTGEFKKIDKDLLRISGIAPGLEAPAVEKPLLNEEA